MLTLRPYQRDCVEAVWKAMTQHTCFSVSTGGGKSVIIAELIRRFLEYPNTTILQICPRKELIIQNVRHLRQHLDLFVDIGIFCAGLNEKKLATVTVASIQSIANLDTLPQFSIVLVDEAHGIPHSADGLYRKVFAKLPDARIIGCTATPWRLSSGLLHKGEDRLFESLCFETKVGDMVRDGWLSPLRAKAVPESADLSNVHKRGGEYIPSEAAEAVDKEPLTQAAVKEVLTNAADRKSILLFAASVEHCSHVADAFKAAGEPSIEIVTEETSSKERAAIVERFKTKQTRILVNCLVFLEGFDYPGVDCLVVLKPTSSTGRWCQILGRGMRKAEGKSDCLVLDFTDAVRRLGPIDDLTSTRATSGVGPAPTKVCPNCQTILATGFKTCPHCQYVFPSKPRNDPKHGREASDIDPMGKGPAVIEDIDVKRVSYHIHECKSGEIALRADYHHGLYDIVSEYLLPEHGGYPTEKCQQWFARRGVSPMPRTAEEALEAAQRGLPWPKKISVRAGKFREVIRCADWQKGEPTKATNKAEDEAEDSLPF